MRRLPRHAVSSFFRNQLESPTERLGRVGHSASHTRPQRYSDSLPTCSVSINRNPEQLIKNSTPATRSLLARTESVSRSSTSHQSDQPRLPTPHFDQRASGGL